MLYKYKPWNKHTEDLLRHGDIFFSPMAWLNDPNEGNFTLKIDQVRAHFINKIAIARGVSESEAENILNKAERDRVVDYQHGINPTLLIIQRYINVFSMSSDGENMLMWSHYADSHKGVCVKFKDTLASLNCDKPIRCKRVTYVKMRTALDFSKESPFEGLMNTIFEKDIEWRYEKEVRIVIPDIEGENGIKLKAPVGSIESVSLGSRFPKEETEKIKNIAIRNDFKLYKADLKNGKIINSEITI